jgi:hypothetical protein
MPIETADRRFSAWLPMPYTGEKKLSRAEWDEYRARRARHLQHNPCFDSGWRRPTPRTAEEVWQKFARDLGAKLEALLPKLDLSADERDEADLTAKQTFTVALDAAVLAGERGAMLTQNRIFDALAARWSDHYRMAREHGPASISYDMKVETVRAAWRDLVRNGVRLDTLYSLIRRGHPDLYTTTRVPTRGYTVAIDLGSPAWTEFVRILDADPAYGRSRKQQRLLLADEEPQLAPPAHESGGEEEEEGSEREKVAGEWAYNRVEVGPRSVELIRRLEAARLWVHAPTLIEDVNRLEQQRDELDVLLWDEFGVDVTKSPAKPRARKKTKERRRKAPSARQWAMAHVRQRVIPTLKELVEEYDEVNGQFLQLRDVRDRLIVVSPLVGSEGSWPCWGRGDGRARRLLSGAPSLRRAGWRHRGRPRLDAVRQVRSDVRRVRALSRHPLPRSRRACREQRAAEGGPRVAVPRPRCWCPRWSPAGAKPPSARWFGSRRSHAD